MSGFVDEENDGLQCHASGKGGYGKAVKVKERETDGEVPNPMRDHRISVSRLGVERSMVGADR